MAASTMAEMTAGRDVLRTEHLLIRILAIDSYEIRDIRTPGGASPREGATNHWTSYDYDTARTTFNTDMVDLS